MKKRCSVCGENLPKNVATFGRCSSKRDGLQAKCRSCNRNQSRAYYLKNKKRMRVQIGKRSEERKLDAFKRICEYCKVHPCVDCGERDIIVLEFDHIRGKKLMTISKMASDGYGWDRIWSEIGKCDVRCANCHRRKTAKSRNHRKLIFSG